MEGRVTPALIFDLDGTLIDSAPDIHRCANIALAACGHGPITLTQARSFIGHGAPVFVERMMEAQGLSDGFDALLAEFLVIYETRPVLARPYPGVMQCLSDLRDRGHRLGLCSNKPIRPSMAVLDHFGLTPLFDSIVGGDSLPQRKPDPAPLLHVMTEMAAERAFFVGDSEVDAEAATRAALPFLLFTEGYRKAPPEALPHAARFDDFGMLGGIVADLG